MHFNYLVYGKPISSEIELPALIQLPEQEKNRWELHEWIYLSKGNVIIDKKRFKADRAYIEIEGVAKFLIHTGSEIIIEIVDGKSMDEIYMYIYNRCIPIILFQRHIFLVHSSGILLRNNKVLLFSAPSGTGKSTISTLLAQKGYPIFTDDTAVLACQPHHVLARASYPMVRLWQNSILIQQYFKESEKQNILSNCDKYAFDIHKEFMKEEVEVAGIVFLNCEGEKFCIRSLGRSDVLYQLMINAYCNSIIFEMGLQKEVFKQMGEIANRVLAWEAVRPEGIDTFSVFTELIEKEIISQLDT